jgi:hypothetical protein
MIFSKKNPPLGFYVYAYLREDNSPYYIGKGKARRAWAHSNKELFKTPLNHSRIVIIESNLTEVGSLALERRIIRWYGRKELETGILRNRTDGGEGISGFSHSDKTKNKIRDKRLGTTSSNASKKNQSIATKGIKRGPHTEERKKAISDAKKGKKLEGRGLESLRESRKLKRGIKRPEHSKAMAGSNNPMFGVVRDWNKGALGYKWYTDGTTALMATDCPIGFVPGRLRK